MSRGRMPLALLIVAILTPLIGRAETSFELKSVKLDLPDDGELFIGSGSDAINNNCLACHSAAMVLNQPALPKAVWQAAVDKIIHVYNALVADEDVAAIVDYLTRTKGTK